MAKLRTVCILFAVLVILYVSEWATFDEASSDFSRDPDAGQVVPHTLQKRNAESKRRNFSIDAAVLASSAESLDRIQTFLNATNFPVFLENDTVISQITQTMSCDLGAELPRCACSEHFAFPHTVCVAHGACDGVSSGPCQCINGFPPDGPFCLPISELLPLVHYELDVQVWVADPVIVSYVRSFLSSALFPVVLSDSITATSIDLTTVCASSSNDSLQCTCEDQYRWSCEECLTYGSCDGISNDTCGCITGIPPDGPFCRSVDQHNFTDCATTTARPTTTSLVLQEYQVLVQLNVADERVVDQVRALLPSVPFPFFFQQIRVSSVNISTVCAQASDGFQCTCEDQYRWSCEDCLTYGSCDDITNNTCGCITRIPPDGPFCQPVYQHNFTDCATTTARPTTTSLVLQEYQVLVQLNVADERVVDQVRALLPSVPFPFFFQQIRVSSVNISTVCAQASDGFQCTCEDQYRWSCEDCLTYGSCDSITNNTCGCITRIPSDGPFCRSVDQHNFTLCNSTPVSPTSGTTPVVNTTVITEPTTIISSTTAATTTPPVTIVTTVGTTAMNTTEATTPAMSVATPQKNTTAAPTAPTTSPRRTTDPPPTPPPPPTTTKATPSTGPPEVRRVTLSVTLDLTFTEDLRDEDSPRYIELETAINEVLRDGYGSLTGFQEAFVTGFRPGSVITDFTLITTGLISEELERANVGLVARLEDIAPVIGSVVAKYESPVLIKTPEPTFTGRNMELTCGPPEIDVGAITGSVWKVNGLRVTGERRQIVLLDDRSVLTVQNVISSDTGTYECTLRSPTLDYLQRGDVPASTVAAAPVVRLQPSITTQCRVGLLRPLECCVQTPYEIRWSDGVSELQSDPIDEVGCIRSNFEINDCSQPEVRRTFTCAVVDLPEFSVTSTLIIFREVFECSDDIYGEGRPGDTSSVRCSPGQQGNRTAECRGTQWEVVEDTCILTVVNELLIASQDLSEEEVPVFAERLNNAVQEASEEISESPATIDALVQILNTVASAGAVITENVTQNLLETVDVIIGNDSSEAWDFLNANGTRNTSSDLLGSLETLAERVDGLFAVLTPRIAFNRTTFDGSFEADLNSTVVLTIPQSDVSNVNITTIALPTLNVVMPTRNISFDPGNGTENGADMNAINAAVVLIRISDSIPNVTLSYEKLNDSLVADTQCVFWNFTLFDSLGAWDRQGCELVSDINDTVTCTCTHLTSFSILMATSIPDSIRLILDVITYVGVGISMASLVICLVIEGYIWKDITRNSTAFMRHVSIVNTALSLLIANICFIIGASIADNPLEDSVEDFTVPVNPCSTATFFMHFFYLAVFFWMLVSALLLLYRTVMVFSHMSKSVMVAVGVTLGYVCPLVIAVITVAVTAPGGGYIRRDLACWLNWFETRALLAMVIPALTIVSINFLIVIVVLFKMLRRGVGDASQTDEKHTLVVVIRCVAILTPLFGLTWALGVGTMTSPENQGIHIAFAFFNSLQGFFILVFGTLLDSKIRALLARKIPGRTTSSDRTQSTSGGLSSLGGVNFMNPFRRNRNIYRVSEVATSSASQSGASESFINT